MGKEDRNAARLRAALDAHNRRDVETLLSLWSEQPVLHHGGATPPGGTYRGAAALADLLTSHDAPATGVRGLEPVEVLTDEDFGAAIFRVRAQREGTAVDATVAYAARFNADGTLQEGWFLASDEAAWEVLYG